MVLNEEITIHFGKNPIRGGIPPRESRRREIHANIVVSSIRGEVLALEILMFFINSRMNRAVQVSA